MVEAAVFFIIGAFRMQFLLPHFSLVSIPSLFLHNLSPGAIIIGICTSMI